MVTRNCSHHLSLGLCQIDETHSRGRLSRRLCGGRAIFILIGIDPVDRQPASRCHTTQSTLPILERAVFPTRKCHGSPWLVLFSLALSLFVCLFNRLLLLVLKTCSLSNTLDVVYLAPLVSPCTRMSQSMALLPVLCAEHRILALV